MTERTSWFPWLRSVLLGRGRNELLPDLGLLALRLGFGLTMALNHGRGTLAGFRESPGDFPDPLGLGPELSMALMVVAELFCALAVAAGLLTRLALVPLVVGMGTAFFVFHADDSFGHKELAFLYLMVWIVLLVAGPGRLSLDRVLFARGRSRARARVAAALLVALPLAPGARADSWIEGDLPREDGRPLEQIPALDSRYGVLTTSDGARLRTILTRPSGAEGALPAIAFVQWLSCDTIELPAEKDDGWSRMLKGVARESGMVMLRTEKAGVGDSEGPACDAMGYDRELAHHREALARLLEHPWVDPERVVVFGASMGATMAPLVARGHDVAGIVVWGGGAKTWLERTLGFERRHRELTGVAPDRLTEEMRLLASFLPEYLTARRHPREIAAADPRLGAAWERMVGTDGETQYGRPVAFHQEAQARDWASAWAAVDAPVLVLYGEYDWFEDEAGHRLIVDLVNRQAPGRARLVVFPGLDHHFQRFEDRADAVTGSGGTVAEGPVVEEILAFLDRAVDRRAASGSTQTERSGDHRRTGASAPVSSGDSRPGGAPGDGASAGASPEGGSATLEAFHAGEALVRRALAALGGAGALRGTGGITLEGAGTFDLTTRMQGMHPERPEPVPLEETLAVDLDENRVAYESHARVNPDADEWIRYLHDGEGRMLIVLHQSGEAFWVPGDSDHKRRYARMVPHLLLEDALSTRGSLRHLGRSAGEESVAVRLPGGESLTLRIEPETALLRGFEYLLDVPLLGDTPVRWRFAEYRAVEGLGPYPSGYRVELGGRPLKEVRYRSVRAGTDGAAVLQAPPGIPIPEPPAPPEPSPGASAGHGPPPLPEVRTLAEGVHLAVGVRSGFHVLFVELSDSVLVVDAPAGYHELQMVPAIDWAGDVTSSSVGRRLLEAVRATVPGKPVRYLVLTHHHGDHAGGVRPFLDAGATVLASAETAGVVERAAEASFRLEPDELTGRDVAPRIEVVEGERTISDGERTVRILDVGSNPHAEGMLVIYLPRERILYQSDLFMPSTSGFPDPARVPVMRWFVRWLDASGLEPEAIYAIHGSAKVTEEQLATIRGLDRARDGAPDGSFGRDKGQP